MQNELEMWWTMYSVINLNLLEPDVNEQNIEYFYQLFFDCTNYTKRIMKLQVVVVFNVNIATLADT